MWYFTWILGIGFAVLLAILNAMWGENIEARQEANAAAADTDAVPAAKDRV